MQIDSKAHIPPETAFTLTTESEEKSFGWVGADSLTVGTGLGLVGVDIWSLKVFRYKHVSIGNLKWLLWGHAQCKVPT